MSNIPQEYPKWRNGKLVNNELEEEDLFGNVVVSSTPPDASGAPDNFKYVEYPKWVGDVLVTTADEELAALEALTKSAD